jgi:hypothetical protein
MLQNNIELINIPFVLNVLLYDDEGESHETNSSVFQQETCLQSWYSNLKI